MKPVSAAITMIFLLVAIFSISQQELVPTAYAEPGEGVDLCKVGALPQTVQSRLRQEFVSWMVQKQTDLSPSARKRWGSEKPSQCPGIAMGRFENAKALSYAVLLIAQDHADAGYKLLVFSPKAGQPSYEMRALDSGESGASNFFIHTVPMSKFFNNESRKTFRAYTSEGILLVDAAEQEYEVNVYFWANGTYQHQPIDY
jgi:hypothetical protein